MCRASLLKTVTENLRRLCCLLLPGFKYGLGAIDGECADLSCDCLRSTAPDQWAIHVPLGKLKTERMVPVDFFVAQLVQRLAFFRSLDPLPADGRLLARPRTKEALVRQLRDYLHQVCHALALSTRIVPHQLRACATISTQFVVKLSHIK